MLKEYRFLFFEIKANYFKYRTIIMHFFLQCNPLHNFSYINIMKKKNEIILIGTGSLLKTSDIVAINLQNGVDLLM